MSLRSLVAGMCLILAGCASTKKEIVLPQEPPEPTIDHLELATEFLKSGTEFLQEGALAAAKVEFDSCLTQILRADCSDLVRDSIITEVCRARLQADRSTVASWRLFTLLDGEFVLNKDVERWLQHYTTKDYTYMEKALSRSQRYLPLIQEIFREEGVPFELSYLPIIESCFHPLAHSRAGAVGLWQFISSTAKKFGLRIDEWVDERRDPHKSSRAAAAYLTLLYDNHGSWSLALAGYNWGPQRVKRSVSRTGNNNYWDLTLPKETAEFVPKFLATLLIALDPEAYGFDGFRLEDEGFDTCIVHGCVNLGVVASASGVELSLIRDLNPELREDFTPPTDTVYSLNLPFSAKTTFRENFYSLPESERYLTSTQVEKLRRKRWITYRIRWGDTLSGISMKFGVSVAQLRKWNPKAKRKYIRAGDKLKIFVN